MTHDQTVWQVATPNAMKKLQLLATMLAFTACDFNDVQSETEDDTGASVEVDVPDLPAPAREENEESDAKDDEVGEFSDDSLIGGLPPGFEGEDRFEDIQDACLYVSKELAPKGMWRPVYQWCDYRSYHSSRYGKVTSKIDGSQIHDRDRPAGWRFYTRGVITGHIDPVNCEYHRIDKSIPHPKASKKMAKNWPFRSPKMTTSLRDKWFAHPHDMERFSSRGPHDNNLPTVATWMPGCWAPEALDRNDVAATATVLRSIQICEKHGCKSKWDIKEHW